MKAQHALPVFHSSIVLTGILLSCWATLPVYAMQYDSCSVLQEDAGRTAQGWMQQKILHIIVYISDSSNPISITSIVLSTDGSTDVGDLSRAQLFYTGLIPVFSDTNLFAETNSPNGNYSLSSLQVLSNGAHHFWLTYDISPSVTDQNMVDAACLSLTIGGINYVPAITNPAGTRTILRTMQGSYLISPSGLGSYTSFTQAAADLVLRGISGPVLIQADTGTYTEHFEISSISGTSALNTVTFSSANGDSSSVLVTYTANTLANNYIVRLQGCKHIIFDKLSFKSGGSTYSNVVNFAGGNDSITFRHCIIEGWRFTTGSYSTNSALIFSSNSYIDHHICIQNCKVINGGTGVLMVSPSLASGLEIRGNVFMGQYFYGISVYRMNQCSIVQNIIESDQAYQNQFYNGINLNYCGGPSSIERNQILVKVPSWGTGIRLAYCICDPNNRGLIANNYVLVNAQTGGHGLYMESSEGYDCYYNTVRIVGINTNSSCYYQNLGNNFLRNNLFSNEASGFAIELYNSSAIVNSDYTGMYTSGITLVRRNMNYNSLSAWQLASSQDLHSVEAFPGFSDPTGPYPVSAAFDGMGVTVSGLTRDLFSILRDTLHPDVGCVEFTAPVNELMLEAFLLPEGGCGLEREPLSIRVRNLGSDSALGNLVAGYSLDAGATYVTDTLTIQIPGMGHADLIFPDSIDLSQHSQDTNYSIRVFIQYSADILSDNDTLEHTVHAIYKPPVPMVADVQVAGGSDAVLNAISDALVMWYENDTSSVMISAGNALKISSIYDSTTYYAASSGTQDFMLTTLYTGANNVKGAMLDIVNDAEYGVLIDSFDINIAGTSTYSMDVYYKTGTHIGYNTTPTAWTHLGTVSVKGAGSGKPTRIKPGQLYIPAKSTYALYFNLSSNLIRVRNTGSPVYSDGQLTIQNTSSMTTLFGALTLNRVFNGSIYSSVSNGCMSERVPARINVSGTPVVQLSDTCLLFPATEINTAATDTLWISNTGTYALHIEDIQVSGTGFSVDQQQMTVLPGNPGQLVVTFSPAGQGNYSATLLLQTNAGNYQVCLSGQCLSAGIEISPDSMLVEFFACHDSTQREVKIKNLSGSILGFEFIGNYGFYYGESSYQNITTSGQTIINIFTGLPPQMDSITLELGFFGDYNTIGKTASLFIDGTYIQEFSPMSTFYIDYTLKLGGAQVKQWIANDTIVVELVNSSLVTPGYGNGFIFVYLYTQGTTWLVPNLDSGSLLPGDSVLIPIFFNTNGIIEGEYDADLKLTTTDALVPEFIIPCTLILNGVPDLQIDDPIIIADTTMVGDSYSGQIWIRNKGCGTLYMTDIQHTSPYFDFHDSSLEVWPGAIESLWFDFNPQEVGTFYDTVQIISNNAPYEVILRGTSFAPPVLEITPAFVEETLYCFESTQRQITLLNSSEASLILSFSLSPGENFISMGALPDTLAPGQSFTINLFFSRDTLGAGSYTRDIIIHTNNINDPEMIIPVALTVVYPYHKVDLEDQKNLCSGQNLVLDAGSGFSTYLWNTGNTIQTLNVSSSGTYAVTVSSLDGCISTDSTEVIARPNPMVSAGSDGQICSGNSIQLQGSVTSGTLPYQISWSPAASLSNPNVIQPTANPVQTTTYVLEVTDYYACVDTDTLILTVQPTPGVYLSDTNILEGDSVWLTPLIAGGEIPYISYTWTPVTALQDPGSAQTWAKPEYTTVYSLDVTGANGCVGSATTIISVTRISNISGRLTYYNTNASPLGNVLVKLYEVPDKLIDSTLSDAAGYYQFERLLNGTYFMRCHAPYSWGGVNATDALDIQRKVVGLINLENLMWQVADVNCSQTITSADALLVMRRFVNLVPDFCQGALQDLVFEDYPILLQGEDREWNIRGLCAGDVNRSYVPGLKRHPSTVFFESGELVRAGQGAVIHLPLQLTESLLLGSVSLVVQIPEGLKLLDIRTPLNNAIYTVEPSMFRFAWQQAEGVMISTQEVLLELEILVEGIPGEIILKLFPDEASEMSDPSAQVYAQVKMEFPPVQIVPASAGDFILYQNYPNPATDFTHVRFYLPRAAKIQLETGNMVGGYTRQVEMGEFPPGYYDIILNTCDLPSGIYWLHVSEAGAPHPFSRFMKFTISR